MRYFAVSVLVSELHQKWNPLESLMTILLSQQTIC